ncbi:hypothetical protein Pint_10877 [Pistacia integerrima]|uniref:Uncharacterized protein n=2 Tax=Pistacia TaxID=55512 RepID=A0ACC1A0L3_9ROSI|nr:hypothetical protein Pint_10877 [Pistacia integerrima]KAJ0080990.1 hypothetical protein Patl1_11044 [Pistacia atlantica]
MEETSPAKLICAIVLTPIFVLSLIFLLLWLSLHPHRPKFHIHEFSVPGLNQTNGFENATITFNVTVRNTNRNFRINYESLNGSVYYKDDEVGSVTLLSSFDQGEKNTTILQHELSGSMSLSTLNNKRWMEFVNDRTKETVIFYLRFTSIIHYEKSVWDRKHHQMHANCDAGVDSNGFLLPNFKDKRCIVHFGRLF